MRSLGAIAVAGALVALAIASGTAQAATTRADWVAQVDPICATAQLQESSAAGPLISASQRVKKHGKSRRRLRKLNRAFNYYLTQQIAIERAANAQIATIPPAPEDTSLVQVWLRARGELLDSEEQLFLGGFQGKGLQGVAQFFNALFELIGRDFETTDLVRDFGFHYCNVSPAGDTGF